MLNRLGCVLVTWSTWTIVCFTLLIISFFDTKYIEVTYTSSKGLLFVLGNSRNFIINVWLLSFVLLFLLLIFDYIRLYKVKGTESRKER